MMMAEVGRADKGGVQPGAYASLRELYCSHRWELVRLAAFLLHDQGEAEEVVQDAFVNMLATPERKRDPAKALPYLRSAVLNGARSRLRHRKVVSRVPLDPSSTGASAEASTVASDERREVLAALRTLPQRQFECLALRYYLELSEAEIAAAVGISQGSVKTHVHRGLAALAARLEGGR
jgi:RNA polymerase sigma-70 factor (sigma-E family)